LLEPHWNQSQLDQVKGRAIRYKSHDHLPENERKVEIQEYVAIPKKRGFIFKTQDMGTDEYLRNLAKKKTDLNDQFLKAMQDVGNIFNGRS